MTYIDSVAGKRDEDGLRWGVESICAQLTELGAKIAPATYSEHRGRRPTAREVRDADLKPKIAAVHAANYGVPEGLAHPEPRTPGATRRPSHDAQSSGSWASSA